MPLVNHPLPWQEAPGPPQPLEELGLPHLGVAAEVLLEEVALSALDPPPLPEVVCLVLLRLLTPAELLVPA